MKESPMRMRIPALAAATVLMFGLAACSNNQTTAGPTPAPTTAEATTEAPATTQAAPTQGGQATPEAAAETMLKAFGAGDARGACAIMSDGKQTLEGNESGLQQCEDALKGLVEQLGKAAPELKDATVTGATINGDTATFENAKVTPDIGQGVLSTMKAAKINGKWYMTR